MAPVRVIRLLKRTLGPAVIVCAIAVPAQATEALTVDQIMDLSGLGGQLTSLSDELQPLLTDATVTCNNYPAQALPEELGDQYTLQSLHRHARNILNKKLDSQTASVLSAWYQSPSGRRIVQAEKAAAHWDETTFDQRISGISASADWDELRRKQILRTVAATQAHKYVASLSASVAGLKQALKKCAEGFSQENRQAARRKVENERDLLAAFLRLELVLPSAAVYRDISAADLEAYTIFAKTPAGRHFHLTLAELFSELLFFPEPPHLR